MPSEEMSRPPPLRRRSEMKFPDQPSTLADGTDNAEATEDEDEAIIIDTDTIVGTMAETVTMIRNSHALTAS
jgi:hypothetical protein